ncbi:hypothetical protein BS78_04G170600 [Paspalum vaginatum]|nr:hypothetical protein BS78_04G170600 [Paspalum vaginatum]
MCPTCNSTPLPPAAFPPISASQAPAMALSRPRRGREEEEEQDGGGRVGGEGSTPAKRPRSCSCSCCSHHQEKDDLYKIQIEILKKEIRCMSKGFTEELKNSLREMQEFSQNFQLQLKEMKELISEQHQLNGERLNTLVSETSALGEHVRKYGDLRALSHQSEKRTSRLKFENKCCNDKYSRHDIMSDDGSPVKVAIYDHENRVITNGPLSSIQVKFVVLDGEFNKENKEQWSENSFKTSIVHSRPGKQPLFANELYLRLEKGVAHLCGAKFQDNSSFIPCKKFKLGVMADDDTISEKVLEGVSESFAVKDGRGYQKKKDLFPFPSDPVYKLKKIGENGDRRKLLEKMGIHLVGDFLWFYNKDANSLRQACRHIPDHDWKIIVEHALSCKLGPERYSYRIPGMEATIFFNSLYNIVGAEFNGKYTSYDKLDSTQKCGDKYPCLEHDVIAEDGGNCYLRGSCSTPPLPTLPTMLHDDTCNRGKALESPRQRWVKVVTMVNTMVTTLHVWNKKKPGSSPQSMSNDDFWVTLELENILVDPETSRTW